MVPDTFNNGVRTAIADTEPFSGDPPEVGFSRGCAVEHNIADQYVVFCGEATVGGWINDYLSAGEPFTDIVVGITLDFNGDALASQAPRLCPAEPFSLILIVSSGRPSPWLPWLLHGKAWCLRHG